MNYSHDSAFTKRFVVKITVDRYNKIVVAVSQILDRVKSVALWSSNIRKLAKDHKGNGSAAMKQAAMGMKNQKKNIFENTSRMIHIHVSLQFLLCKLILQQNIFVQDFISMMFFLFYAFSITEKYIEVPRLPDAIINISSKTVTINAKLQPHKLRIIRNYWLPVHMLQHFMIFNVIMYGYDHVIYIYMIM